MVSSGDLFGVNSGCDSKWYVPVLSCVGGAPTTSQEVQLACKATRSGVGAGLEKEASDVLGLVVVCRDFVLLDRSSLKALPSWLYEGRDSALARRADDRVGFWGSTTRRTRCFRALTSVLETLGSLSSLTLFFVSPRSWRSSSFRFMFSRRRSRNLRLFVGSSMVAESVPLLIMAGSKTIFRRAPGLVSVMCFVLSLKDASTASTASAVASPYDVMLSVLGHCFTNPQEVFCNSDIIQK